MATRGTIAVVHGDGTVSQVYCHYDNYLSGTGVTLVEHYDTLERAEYLVSLGDISALGPLIEPTSDSHTFNHPDVDVTVYYGRDRGEADCEPAHYSSVNNYLDSRSSEEYNYLYQAGAWFYVEERDANFKLVARDLATTEEE